MRTRATTLLAGGLALALLAAGCTAEDSDLGDDEPSSAGEETATLADGSATPGEGPVQDTWVYERVRTVAEDGSPVDITDDLLAGVSGDPDSAVELLDGVTFTPVPQLAARVRDDATHFRDDLDVVAGIVETDQGRALQVIATPTGTRSVDADDLLVMDLTFLGLDPGAPLLVDFAFGQGLPSTDSSAASGAELLGERMADELFQWYGVTTDSGSTPGLQTVVGSVPDATGDAQVDTAALDTSATGTDADTQFRFAGDGQQAQVVPVDTPGLSDGVPLKAQPTVSPVDDLADCDDSPLQCISDYFDAMEEGFEESLDSLFGDNMPPTPKEPPDPCSFVCGGASGEPHLSTFDGLRYDLQQAGEFTLATSDAVTVQTRLAPYRSSTRVSIVTAAAVEVAGHRVTARIGRDPVVQLDGAPVPMDELIQGVGVGAGLAWAFGGSLYVEGPDDVLVTIRGVQTSALDVYVDSGSGDLDWQALLGSPDGDRDNDLVTRNGDQLASDLPTEDLYGVFAESWRISDGESLFDYEAGESTATFTDRSFPTEHLTFADLNARDRTIAETLCRMVGIVKPVPLQWCIYDYAVTGDMSFVRAARHHSATVDAPAGTWAQPITGVLGLDGRPVLDQDAHVLVPSSAEEGDRLTALDIATGEPAWESETTSGCVAVTDSGAIVATQTGQSEGVSVAVLDPADGSQISLTPSVLPDCESMTAVDERVFLRDGDQVFGFDPSAPAITSEVEVAGLAAGPVLGGDGTVWLTRNEDGQASAVQIDPASGDLTSTDLPVAEVGRYAAATPGGFAVGYQDEDGGTGGILRFSSADGPRQTPLPQTQGDLDFADTIDGPLFSDGEYLAGYLNGDTVGVLDATTGQPLQALEPSSFNNNGSQLFAFDGLVAVSPFGGSSWVEAYSAADGMLVWTAPPPDSIPELADLGVNDAKIFGPSTDAGQLIVLSSMRDGIAVALVGPGR